MSANELRRDYLLDRWVVIATQRKRRPTDFVKKPELAKSGSCPFCPGNEEKTPPAFLVYLPSGKGKIKKTKDKDGIRHRGWLIRGFNNLFPAFTAPMQEENKVKSSNFLSKAIGAHEVVVESPRHDEHPGTASLPQLELVVEAYLERLKALSAAPYIKYVSIFRNHGLEAGASLSHAHSQIIATPFVPRLVREELNASRTFWKKHGNCALCDILERERKSQRFIWENKSFCVFAPWASVNPLEFWILPRRHQASPLEMKHKQKKDLTIALRVCLGGLRALLEDPPYNYGLHITPDVSDCGEFYHWHVEVYPKLAIWAGFEKSTGVYINTVTPEDAAASLKEAVRREEKLLFEAPKKL